MHVSKSLTAFFDLFDKAADSNLSLLKLMKELPATANEVALLTDDEFSELLEYSKFRVPHEELSEIMTQILLTMRSICTSRMPTNK